MFRRKSYALLGIIFTDVAYILNTISAVGNIHYKQIKLTKGNYEAETHFNYFVYRSY